MLAQDDHADLRKTAEKADTLFAIHAKHSHDGVAAVESEADAGENTVPPFLAAAGPAAVAVAAVHAAVAPAAVATLPPPTSKIRCLHRGL